MVSSSKGVVCGLDHSGSQPFIKIIMLLEYAIILFVDICSQVRSLPGDLLWRCVVEVI